LDEQERTNLIRILQETIQALRNKDSQTLKDLSNQSIHDASILQERHAITLAVLIYALSKIHERQESYSALKGWKSLCINCDTGLEVAKHKLENKDYNGFDEAIKLYMKNLGKLDAKLRTYILDVFQRAKINKASRIYEHGISIGRTAELLNVSRFELMDYVGKTFISDVQENITLSVKNRLKIARGLFL